MKQARITTSKLLVAILVMIIAIASFLLAIDNLSIAKADTKDTDANLCEDKIYTHSEIEDDFEDDSLLVVMDRYSSDYNKNHDEIFSQLPLIESIKDLTSIDGDIESKEYLNKTSFRQILKITLKEKSKQKVLDTISQIEEIDGVLWAGVSGYDSVVAAPAMSGISYPLQWGLNWQYGINVEGAWKYTTGNKAVRVGVIDTGIANHEDLNANLVSGWDFYNDNEVTNDDVLGHGTHVAGIIGATGANANGVMGVCPNLQLVPLQVYINGAGDTDNLSREAIVSAITWAMNNNVDILNYSAGDNNNYVPMATAIENYTGLFICGAGNKGSDNDSIPFYPSNFSYLDRVISVGATNEYGDIFLKSNYGNNSVSLFAPGENILSTYPTSLEESGYKTMYGTSMAAPFVTGVAALMYSQYFGSYGIDDTLIASRVKQAILNNVTKDDRYKGKCYTGGRLNAEAALRNMPYRKVSEDFGYSDGKYQWNGTLNLNIDSNIYYYYNDDDDLVITEAVDLKFALGTKSVYNILKPIESTINIEFVNNENVYENIPIEGHDVFNCQVKVGLLSNVSYTNRSFTINTLNLENGKYSIYLSCDTTRDGDSRHTSGRFSFIVQKSPACVVDGTLITLADGSQVPVESLKGDETLLVWNMFTGKFDVAPILFLDKDPAREYKVINLYFSDGTCVKVIDEHGFWDFNLNRYVFLRDDASQYVGHWFNKQIVDEDGNFGYTKVQLTDVVLQNEYTSAWSPVTYGHLCYYVNGMLSMPGATTGLINIFDVNPDTMTIDRDAFLADIQQYGLFTYGEFAEIYSIPEMVFEAFGGQYLKVSIGKGLITYEQLESLIARYSVFWKS
ncbi:MAG: S8 family serine peptidase [Clostridiales bacterium]|nr:S8 family serine peptidase [Clostridiales bacterium]